MAGRAKPATAEVRLVEPRARCGCQNAGDALTIQVHPLRLPRTDAGGDTLQVGFVEVLQRVVNSRPRIAALESWKREPRVASAVIALVTNVRDRGELRDYWALVVVEIRGPNEVGLGSEFDESVKHQHPAT